MSENENSEKNNRKMNSNGKEKKRKRKRTDLESSEDIVEPKNSKNQSDEIEENTELDNVEIKKPKEPSKRQLKREKIEKKYAEQREASKLGAAQKALNYISKWKHAKSDWKFEKLRQIWLMDNLLDEDLVPDSIFPIALEYFEGSKGMARQQLVKKMMLVIKKVEDLNTEIDEDEEKEEKEEKEENEEKESTNSTEYQRARQVLQALPSES